MSGFNASKVVEPIQFNLSPYVDKHGIIPEPSTAAIQRFEKAMLGLAEKVGVQPGEMPDPEKVKELGEGVVTQTLDTMVEAVVDVANGAVTKDDLNALPFRIKTAFIQWIMSELLSGEGMAPAMKR